VNVLPDLLAYEPELAERMLARADRPETAWDEDPVPRVQIISEAAWAEATAALPPPDYAFGLAEAMGEAAVWRQSRLLPSGDERILFPEEASHVERLMLFTGQQLVVRSATQDEEVRVRLTVVAGDLQQGWSLGELSKQMINDLDQREPARWRIFARLRPFARARCGYDRSPFRCVPTSCRGECRAYIVKPGPDARQVCTCNNSAAV
jgi:hypothetical protein